MMARIRPERKGPRQNLLTDRLRSTALEWIWALLPIVKRRVILNWWALLILNRHALLRKRDRS